jgi:hypothetical protein
MPPCYGREPQAQVDSTGRHDRRYALEVRQRRTRVAIRSRRTRGSLRAGQGERPRAHLRNESASPSEKNVLRMLSTGQPEGRPRGKTSRRTRPKTPGPPVFKVSDWPGEEKPSKWSDRPSSAQATNTCRLEVNVSADDVHGSKPNPEKVRRGTTAGVTVDHAPPSEGKRPWDAVCACVSEQSPHAREGATMRRRFLTERPAA